MKKIIIYGVILVLVIVAVIGGLLLVNKTNSNQTVTPPPPNSFPESTSTNESSGQIVSNSESNQTVSVTNGGTPITTRNFLNDPGVIHNPNNTPDYDILVGTSDPSAPNPPYEIDYSAKDQSFGITLYKEPLGQYRIEAENDLMKRLGITQTQMCNINYIVATGPGINDTYAGKNLGFSFCPGATALPQ
jgi:hypothetical protein